MTNLFELNPIAISAYFFLFLSVILLWLPYSKKIWLWTSSTIIAIILGLISHVLTPLSLIFIALLAVSAYYFYRNDSPSFIRIMAGIGILLLGMGSVLHLIPGYHNLNIFHHLQLTADCAPFTFYLNFDKAITGIFILGFAGFLISKRQEWLLMFKQTLPRAAIVIIIMMILSLAAGIIKFEPKIPPYFLLWSITNLLIVCVSEEAVFRGFIQQNLAAVMQNIKWGKYIAILPAAILFGITHYHDGLKIMIFATVAGIGYGWIYAQTKRIEASILTHFSLNLIQILLFSYPILLSAVR